MRYRVSSTFVPLFPGNLVDEYTQNREILLSGVPEGTGIIVWEWPFLLGLGLGAANGCIECTTATTQAVFCSNDAPSKKWWFSFRTIHNYICCLKIPLKSINTFGTVLEPFFNVEQGYLDVGRTVTMQLVSVQDINSRWSEGVWRLFNLRENWKSRTR